MARYLADTSVLARRKTRPEVREVLEPLFVSGRVATCGMIDLELLYSATSPADYAGVAAVLRALPRVHMTEAVLDRALEVQGRLARRSQHRGASLPDLIVAASAESVGLTVLHYDADYERIAEVTGQPVAVGGAARERGLTRRAPRLSRAASRRTCRPTSRAARPRRSRRPSPAL